MKLIVITYPTFFQGEAQCVDALFRNGLEYLHLRKPEADVLAYVSFLEQVDPQYYPRIVLHDHFELAEKYGLKGVHLNQRNPYPPQSWKGHVSRSCHSLEEVVAHKPQCDYLFLSPIFDSISKQGYGPSLSPDMLRKAKEEGIIDDKVVALGGMSAERLPLVRSWGFGGAAFLGDVWNPFMKGDERMGVEHFIELRNDSSTKSILNYEL